MRRLLLNSSALTVGAVFAQVLTAVALWLAARVLEPARFGLFVGLLGLVTLAATVADFGVNAVSIRWLAHHPEDGTAFTTTLSAKLLLAVVLGASWVALSVFGVALGMGAEADGFVSALLGLYLVAAVISTTLAVPLRGRQRMTLVAIGGVLEELVVLVVTAVLLLGLKLGTEGVALGFVAGSVASAMFYAALLDPRLRVVRRPTARDLVELWHQSLDFGLSSLSVQLQRADVAIVGVIAGAQSAGIFAIPARLTNPLGIIPSAFSAALYPRVAADGDSSRAQRDAAVAGGIMLAVMVAAMAFVFATADWTVRFLLGPEYADAASVLRVYAVAMVAASATQPMAVYLQAVHDERYVARTVMGAAAVGLVLVGVGAAAGGATGAAFGFAAQQAMILLALFARFVRRRSMGIGMPKSEGLTSANT